MLKYIITPIVWILACADGAYAQLNAWPQVTELDKSNVYFACNVSKLTVVYLRADFELGTNENRRSMKSAAASEIETASRPDKGIRQFLDFAAGYEVTIDRGTVKPPLLKLEPKKGLDFPVWHARWELFPTSSGFSGVPFEYHTFVRKDGKRIAPRLYFCDFVYVKGRTCFCNLPIAAIESSAGKPIITADKALELATQAMSRPSVPEDVRKSLALKQIILQELPFAKEMWDEEASIFELQYQERDTVDRLLDRKPLSVWVTIDGTCSTITLDGWAVEN